MNLPGGMSNFLESSVELMKVMARACGHSHLNKFCKADLATFNMALSQLSGIEYSGFNSEREFHFPELNQE